MIGSGPFKLQEWRPNEQLVAVRNPDYWRPGLPYLDKITFVPVTDGPTRVNQLEGGQLDAMHTSGAAEMVSLRGLAKKGEVTEHESAKGSEVTYLMLNVAKPPFDDPLARQIVALGRNTAQINQIRNRDLFPLAYGPFPPGSIGHLDDPGFPKPNLKKARALEKQYEAKHGGPLTFEYLTQPDPETVAIAELIQAQAAKYGVKVTIRTEAQSGAINDALAGNFTGSRVAQPRRWRPRRAVRVVEQRVPGELQPHLDDPEIDRLLDAGRVETDPAKRATIYEDLTRRFATQLYNLWSWHPSWTVAARKGSTGCSARRCPTAKASRSPSSAGTCRSSVSGCRSEPSRRPPLPGSARRAGSARGTGDEVLADVPQAARGIVVLRGT